METKQLPLHAMEAKATTVRTNELGRERVIGGSKGHVNETIQGSVLRLFESFQWKMIPKCTGRYTCRDHNLVSHLSPAQLLASLGIEDLPQFSFSLEDRTDVVLVTPLDEKLQTGIITYVKQTEGSLHYVHTLNTSSGFQRKLRAIGIEGLVALAGEEGGHEQSAFTGVQSSTQCDRLSEVCN